MIPLPWLLVARRAPDLARVRGLPLSVEPEAARALPFVRYEQTVRAGDGGWARCTDAMRTYTFFPPERLQGWVDAPDGRIAPGTTILQRVRVGLVGFDSATRVTAVEEATDDAGRRTFGFDYVTLAGHPERGLARFRIAETGDGSVRASIETWSAPAAWWARLGAPVTGLMQRRTNRSVVARMAGLVGGGDR